MTKSIASSGPAEMNERIRQQMRSLGFELKQPRVSPSRGRPRKQEPVLAVFRSRLRAGLTDQLWLRERNQIQRGWSGPNVPSDRTIKRAIAHLYKQLRWLDGVVTKESAAEVLAQ